MWGGGDVWERRGEYGFSGHSGMASLCSLQALEEFAAFVLLPGHTAWINQGCTNSTDMSDSEDKKMSEGKSNNKKVRIKEQVYFKHIFVLSTWNIYPCPTHVVLGIFKHSTDCCAM